VDRVTVTDGWLAERGGAVAVRYAAHGGPAKLVLADSGEPLGLYSLAQDPREQQPATIDAAALAFLRASWAGDGVQPGCLPPAP